jgi:hypothetical protein
MLLQSLKYVCWDVVPKTIQLELERFNRANLQKSMALTGELFRLLEAFQQNGVPIAAFKGPVLAESVYGNLSLREFNDLDVIVQKEDLRAAEEILMACGYLAQFPDKDYRSTFYSYQGQYGFCHAQTRIAVDLHWQLSRTGVPFPVQATEVWSKLREVKIGRRKVLTLADDDLVLFLAAHGTKEGWRRLIWVSDFAELLRRCQNVNWAELLDRAHRSHSSRSLLLAIDLASTLLGAPAPAYLTDRSRTNSSVRALSEKVRLRILSAAPQEEFHEFLDSLETYDLFRHRLRLMVTLLTTRTVGDYEAMPLPKPLWSIYYLTRPFRLAGKIGKMVLGKK